MERGWYFRLVMVLAVVLTAGYLLYPSFYFYTQATETERESHTEFCKALPTWVSCNKLSLGLDLQGGVHLVMGVRVEKAVEHRLDRVADSLREALKAANLGFSRIDRPRDQTKIVVVLADNADPDAFEKLLRADFSAAEVASHEGKTYNVQLLPAEVDAVKASAVEQAIKTIRNRADKLGVTEPAIARRGADSVLIQLPGVKDPERAIDIIGRTAQLEFKIVDEAATAVFDEIADADLPEGASRQQTTVEGPGGEPVREVFFEVGEDKKEALLAVLAAKVPSSREVAFGLTFDGTTGLPKQGVMRTYLLDARAGITGDYLTDAAPQQDPQLPGQWHVSMSFDMEGARIFERLTEQNVRRRMAIVLDDVVNSAPVINEKIGGGRAQITLGRGADGQKQFQESKDLALVLKAGALPAPVEIREKRQVGRTLGEKAVQDGVLSLLIGTVIVALFMGVYYRASGMVANIALLLNVVLVLAVMAMFGATLTLPGMAGLVLTIAMAVDANIIIFERIREELRGGKTVKAAIDAGYERAFSTIVDSNLTTLICGIVLMQYGTGPVRGFAVTLIVGIACSMFSAITVTRLIFDMAMSRRRFQTLSI